MSRPSHAAQARLSDNKIGTTVIQAILQCSIMAQLLQTCLRVSLGLDITSCTSSLGEIKHVMHV